MIMMMMIIMNIIYYYYYYYIYIYSIVCRPCRFGRLCSHLQFHIPLVISKMHLRPCGSKCWRLCRWGSRHLRGLQTPVSLRSWDFHPVTSMVVMMIESLDVAGCCVTKDDMGMGCIHNLYVAGCCGNVWKTLWTLWQCLTSWWIEDLIQDWKTSLGERSVANFFSILTFDIRHWSFWRVEVVHQERVVHSDLKAGAGKSARWDRDSEFVLPLWSPLHIPQRHDEIRWILSPWRCSCLPRISKLPTGFQTFQSRCLLICQNPKLFRTTTKCNQLWLCLHSFDFFVHLSGYSLATSSWWSSDWSWSTLASPRGWWHP